MAARLAARGAESARLRVERTPPPRAYLPMTPTVDVVVADTGVQGVLYSSGDAEAAVRILEAMPRDLETRQIAGYEDWNLSDAQYVLGRYAEATATAQQGLSRIVEPHRAPGLWSGLMAQLAECQLALGRWDDAGTTLTRCGDLVVDDDLKSQALALAGLLACWRGRLGEAATLLARVQAAPTPMPEPADLVRPRWLAAELAAARNDLDLVRSTARPDVERPRLGGRLRPPVAAAAAGAPAGGGHPRAGRRRGRRPGPRARRGLPRGRGPAAPGRRRGRGLGPARPRRARSRRRLHGSRSVGGDAARPGTKAGRVVEAAWARLRQAGCLAATRQRDEASAAVAGVRSLAGDLGAVGLRAAADALATRIAGHAAGAAATRRTASPAASSRCCDSSRWVAATPRSPRTCSSRRRPSPCTSHRCSPSSRPRLAPRRWPPPSGRVCSSRSRSPDRAGPGIGISLDPHAGSYRERGCHRSHHTEGPDHVHHPDHPSSADVHQGPADHAPRGRRRRCHAVRRVRRPRRSHDPASPRVLLPAAGPDRERLSPRAAAHRVQPEHRPSPAGTRTSRTGARWADGCF